MLPEIIKKGKLVADDVRNRYGNGGNKKFAYITHDVEIDGKNVSLKLDIKKSPQKNKFWVHRVELIENANDFPASTNNGTEAGQTTVGNGDIITHPDEKVNTLDEKSLLSDRDSDILYSDRVTDKRTLEALKKPVENVTRVNIIESSELLLSDRDSNILYSERKQKVDATVDKAIKQKGNLGVKYNQERISEFPADITAIVSAASEGRINLSGKYVAINGSDI